MSSEDTSGQRRYEPASFRERFTSRLFDAVTMVVIQWVSLVAVWKTAEAIFGLGSVADNGWVALIVLVLGSIPMMCYEVIPTSRTGRTFWKLRTVQVIRWDAYINPNSDHILPNLYRSFLRWLTPHSIIVLGSILIWQILRSPDSSIEEEIICVYIALGSVFGWVVIYFLSRFDKHGRGSHDIAAGTVVVQPATCSDTPEPARPVSPKHLDPQTGPAQRQPVKPIAGKRYYYGPVTNQYYDLASGETVEHDQSAPGKPSSKEAQHNEETASRHEQNHNRGQPSNTGPGDDALDGGDGTDHLDGGPGTDSCRRADTTTSCETEARL